MIIYDGTVERDGGASFGSGDVVFTDISVPANGILILQGWSFGTDSVGTPDVDAANFTEFTESPQISSTGGEVNNEYLHAFIYPVRLSSGTYTVTVPDNGNAANKNFILHIFTADVDVAENDLDFISGSGANPSGTLSIGGVTSQAVIFWRSGQNNITAISPITGWTDAYEDDLGSNTQGAYYLDTPTSADITYGITQASEEYAIMAVAFNETAGGGSSSLVYNPNPMRVHITQ